MKGSGMRKERRKVEIKKKGRNYGGEEMRWKGEGREAGGRGEHGEAKR